MLTVEVMLAAFYQYQDSVLSSYGAFQNSELLVFR